MTRRVSSEMNHLPKCDLKPFIFARESGLAGFKKVKVL